MADFRFTQDAVIEVAAGSSEKADWIATFVDYRYLSDHELQRVQPDRYHAVDQPRQDPDGVQATAVLVTSMLVIACAVGALGSG